MTHTLCGILWLYQFGRLAFEQTLVIFWMLTMSWPKRSYHQRCINDWVCMHQLPRHVCAVRADVFVPTNSVRELCRRLWAQWIKHWHVRLTWLITTSTHTKYNNKSPIGLHWYRAGARCPIPDTAGRSYTDTDTRLYKFFCTENAILCGVYVQVIYVCGVYARKYGIGLKLQACVATVLTVTNDRSTGIGSDTQISISRYWYPPILASIGRYPTPVSSTLITNQTDTVQFL